MAALPARVAGMVAAMSAVVVLSVEELRSVVREAVRAELADRTEDPVLTREEAAKVLDVHPVMLPRYVRTKGLKGAKLGRNWRFRRSDLLEWLAKQGGV